MTNFYGLPLEFQKIHQKCSYNTFFLVGVSHSGLPRTNPNSSRIENCTQGTPDVKSSGLNHSATLPPITANYEARVNAPRASSYFGTEVTSFWNDSIRCWWCRRLFLYSSVTSVICKSKQSWYY